MKKLINSASSPSVSSRTPNSRQTVVYVLAVGFVGALILALININPWQMVSLGIVFLIALWS
jgi:hypothetical protein